MDEYDGYDYDESDEGTSAQSSSDQYQLQWNDGGCAEWVDLGGEFNGEGHTLQSCFKICTDASKDGLFFRGTDGQCGCVNPGCSKLDGPNGQFLGFDHYTRILEEEQPCSECAPQGCDQLCKRFWGPATGHCYTGGGRCAVDTPFAQGPICCDCPDAVCEEKAETSDALKDADSQCSYLKTTYGVQHGISWGSLPVDKRPEWARLRCDDVIKKQEAAAREPAAPEPAAPEPAAPEPAAPESVPSVASTPCGDCHTEHCKSSLFPGVQACLDCSSRHCNAETCTHEDRQAHCMSTSPGSVDKQVFWLHIPKCGSSFKTSTMMYGFYRFGYTCHKPVPKEFSEEDWNHVAGMFRSPKQQKVSMYLYLKTRFFNDENGHLQPFGAGGAWGWDDSSPEVRRIRMAIYNNGSIADTLGSYTGCQANMVLGERCMRKTGDGHPDGVPPETIADLAFERVKKFRFVGLTENWTMSICLFNYLMTGTRYVTQGQLVNTRPTSCTSDHDVACASTEESYDESDVPYDPIDGRLYVKIAAHFAAQLTEHSISESTCPDLTDAVPSSLPSLRLSRAVPRADTSPLPRAPGPAHNTTEDPCGCGQERDEAKRAEVQQVLR